VLSRVDDASIPGECVDFGLHPARVLNLRAPYRLHTHRTLEIVQVLSKQKAPICGAFAKPPGGLEPPTLSLPWSAEGNRSQPTAKVFAYLSGLRAVALATGCQRLQPRGSIKAPSCVVSSDYACRESRRFGGSNRMS
jgi:hypothetical protein